MIPRPAATASGGQGIHLMSSHRCSSRARRAAVGRRRGVRGVSGHDDSLCRRQRRSAMPSLRWMEVTLRDLQSQVTVSKVAPLN